MQVTIDGQQQDMQITRKQDASLMGAENLYVNDTLVARVTHSHADDIPVILQLESGLVVEVDRQSFYSINGMNYDWQPGVQTNSLTGA